jgi:NADPH:quinone reductase-like Zn-dependent oxidoreductase
MRAAVLKEFGGDVTVRDVPEPASGIGQVLVVIGARFDLGETAAAYRAMQANEVFGRIIVKTRRR